MKHTKTFAAAVLVVSGLSLSAAEYTAETAATKWSEIAAGEWSPSEFVSDAASTATVTTTASAFALDAALTADLLRIRSGGQDVSVTMSVKPTVQRLAFDGANGKIVFGSGLPSVLGLTFDGTVDIGGPEKPATTGQSITIVGGTTTFTRNALISVENIDFSITVEGGVVQTTGNGHLYTGHIRGTRTYNVLGGKFACALTIPNQDSRGIYINVSGGEFAPPFIRYHQGGSGIGDYSGTAMNIRLSDGLFAVPQTLPDWAVVTATGGSICGGDASGSSVYSTLTIAEGASLSLVPGVGPFTFMADVKGAGTLVAEDGALSPIATNRFEGAIRFVTGKKLVFDTSRMSGDEGVIVAEGGFVFPEGKTIADIAEFVGLSNPHSYMLEAGEDGKSVVVRRLAGVDYTVSTSSETLSGIADDEWQPHAFSDDNRATLTVTTSASTFALDRVMTVGTVQVKSGGADLSVTFPAALNATRRILNGENGKIVLNNGLPAVPGLTFDGEVDIGGGEKPATSGQSFTVIGGTTTFTRNALISVENIDFSITVEGGVVQTTGNGHLYTGHISGTRTYNVLGGKFACALTIPNQDSRGIYINVSGGEFAPPFIRYHQGGSGIGDYTGTAMDIQLSGGLFSVPPTLPDWAVVTASGGSICGGSATGSSIYSTLTIEEGKSLSLVPGVGPFTFMADVKGAGTLVAEDGALSPIATNRFEGAIRFVTGKKLVFDTSRMSGDEGVIVAEGGFVFPEDKTIADIAEFVVLSNPYAFNLETGADGKSVIARRGTAVAYTISTSSETLSGVADDEWQPHAFFDDRGSSLTLTTSASTFAFDKPMMIGTVRITSGGGDLGVMFPTAPDASQMAFDGGDGKVVISGALPSVPECVFDGTVELGSSVPMGSGQTITVIGGTTTFTYGGLVDLQNRTVTINVEGGVVQTASGGHLYSGHDQGTRTYNVSGGKFACAISVESKDSQGICVNVSGGEFAPPLFRYRLGEAGEEDWVHDTCSINLTGGMVSVPTCLPRWAPISVTGDAQIRGSGQSVVHSVLTVEEGCTLSAAPSEVNSSIAFCRDIQGTGTFAIANDLTWRLISTNRLAGAMRFVTGKKLTLDTSILETEDGAIIADAGLIFPEGKSLADINEFVALSNPYGYELVAEDSNTLIVRSRGAITCTAHTAAAKWSEIEDSDWDPFAYVPDARSLARVYSTAAGFAFDTAVVGDDIRFVTDSGAACNVTFTASPKVKTLTVDGSNGLVNVTSALPSGIPALQFCGDTSISIEKPWSGGCVSFDVTDGTMTLNGNGKLFNVENQPFTINVRGGLLQNKDGVRIYTGYTGGNHQYFNVFGGKMTSRLAIASYKARGSHVNVYGGEFAPTAINYNGGDTDGWQSEYNGAAVPIMLMGGVFSVPAVLPAWAETTAVSNSTIRAQGNASVYSEVKVEEDATLTVTDSENGGLLMFLNDVTGTGTLALDGDLAVRPGITIEGKLRFRAGHALLFAADATTVTNAQLTVQGGFEFDGCEQKDLSRLVRFTDPHLHGYVPVIRGKVLRMAKQGLCIYVR